jgi:hypothetical protein
MNASSIGAFAMIIVMSAALQGCATPATPQGMTVASSSVERTNAALAHAIRIDNVNGGQDTNPLWTSQVGPDGFRRALEDSLKNAGYIAAAPGQAKYSLSANLLQLNQPVFGLTFEVASSVEYRLTGDGVNKSMPVSVTGSASFSDAAFGVERLRIANERSILENIRALLKQLGELKL